MKPTLVGECNPYGADPYFALYPLPENASGGRLARILGLSRTEYLRRFDRVNLCEGSWSLPAARAKAQALRDGRPLVLLGAKVCAAFKLAFVPFMQTGLVEQVEPTQGFIKYRRIAVAYILPHPSGLNRIWNESDAVEKSRLCVAEFLR